MHDMELKRADVVNYLTVFKCLMDTDEGFGSFQKTDMLGKKIPLPKLVISKKQLVRCIPYVVMLNHSLNVNKFNQVLKTEIPYISFMEFLEVFCNAAQEEIIMDS